MSDTAFCSTDFMTGLVVCPRPMCESVRLIALGREHAEAMYRWMLDPEVADNLGLRQKPSLERTHDWIANALASSSCHPFAILWQDRHVGNVVLDQIDAALRSGRLSIYLGENGSRGRGIGTAAVALAVKLAFEELELNKVWLLAHSANLRAIHAYQKIGFRQEGLMQDGFLLRGQLVPAMYMALLRRNYSGVPG